MIVTGVLFDWLLPVRGVMARRYKPVATTTTAIGTGTISH
jgi:hypothetical protein